MRGGWRDSIELPADGGQCDWHSWHLGTAAAAAARQHSAPQRMRRLKGDEWGGEGDCGAKRFSHFCLLLLSALPVLKAIKEQISSQREGR